tara:strand:- start:2132 stop:2662 length:531 start_codon:yes stop_codon:yes gene_type:complete
MFIKTTPITCNIFESYLEADAKIINFIDEISYKKTQMYTSFDALDVERDSNFKNLFLKLYSEWVVTFLKKVLKKQFKELQLLSIWCQKYEKESRHGMHVHHENTNYISFIWYVDCSEKSSNTIFYNPGHPYCSYFEGEVKPEKNKIIFFDSFIPHEVVKNNDTKRCVISGNFKIIK